MQNTEERPKSELGQSLIDSLLLVHERFATATNGEFSDKELRFRVNGAGSNIIWLLGHMAWTYDFIALRRLANVALLPDEYQGLFAFGTMPSNDLESYPSAKQLIADHEKSFQGYIAFLRGLSTEQLLAPIPAAHPGHKFFETYAKMARQFAFHESYHAGQIGLLKAVQRAVKTDSE